MTKTISKVIKFLVDFITIIFLMKRIGISPPSQIMINDPAEDHNQNWHNSIDDLPFEAFFPDFGPVKQPQFKFFCSELN